MKKSIIIFAVVWAFMFNLQAQNQTLMVGNAGAKMTDVVLVSHDEHQTTIRFAQNILCVLYGICTDEMNEIPRYARNDADSPTKPETIPNTYNSYDLTVLRSYGLQTITLHPNPTTGEFTVRGEAPSPVLNVEIFDIYGRKLLEDWFSYGLMVLRSYDLTVFPAGIYFVKITTETNIITQKLITSIAAAMI